MTPADIRSLRARLNLSQIDFAARVGVSEPTIHRWEQGHSRPQARQLTKLCELYTEAHKSVEIPAWQSPDARGIVLASRR